MKVWRQLQAMQTSGGGECALAIGNFDGCHLGHRALLHQNRQAAIAGGLHCAVLTFEPHPLAVLRPGVQVRRLGGVRDKIVQLASCGVDLLYPARFNNLSFVPPCRGTTGGDKRIGVLSYIIWRFARQSCDGWRKLSLWQRAAGRCGVVAAFRQNIRRTSANRAVVASWRGDGIKRQDWSCCGVSPKHSAHKGAALGCQTARVVYCRAGYNKSTPQDASALSYRARRRAAALARPGAKPPADAAQKSIPHNATRPLLPLAGFGATRRDAPNDSRQSCQSPAHIRRRRLFALLAIAAKLSYPLFYNSANSKH